MLTEGTITLRAPEPSDVNAMYLWENDPTIWIDGALRAPMQLKMLHDFVDSYNPDPAVAGQLRLIVTVNSTAAAVGCIDLYEYDSVNRRSGLGIVIDPAHQRCGYGHRAVELMARYCREMLGLHQLWSIAARENEASIRLFTGCGFSTCGSLRSWIRVADRYTDALMFQRLL